MANPTIAILGKPNVGKSTLFNRLVGAVHSIVSPEEGVTRDRVYGTFDWRGRFFNVIDTGGYIPDSDDVIDAHVRFQAEIAAEEADLVILVMDGRSVITSSDRVLAEQVQKSEKPFVLAINKIDEQQQEFQAMEFYELGLGEFYSISAQNNRSIGDMLDKIHDKLPAEKYQSRTREDCINLAIVGMPNVGKSSLMNSLLQEEKSIVTPIAGTTRDSVDSFLRYNKRDIRLIDTAGLRKKSKITGDIEFYSTIRTFRVIDECDVAAVLIDADKGFNNQDKDIIRHVIDSGKGLMVVVNKWDLVEKETETLKEYHLDITDQFPALAYYPVLFVSVAHNRRIREVIKLSLEIFDERRRKVKTSELNDFLKKTVSHHNPPLVKGRNINLKYGAQVRHSPPIFAFFANHPDLIPIQYKRYIENSLRDYFGFSGVPVKISFRLSK
ncbi:MAG: ribosome biogenesis GTPase Der [Candidatus Marinimicrobia bacterium]|nr:ribosome biogenesis GTPase Der [Candidatus Neomarinimicrobiota bacterium]